MKKYFFISLLLLIVGACKEDPVDPPVITSPVVITENFDNVISTVVEAKGTVIKDGGVPVLERGLICKKTSEPTSEKIIIVPGAIGTFSALFKDLDPNTYYSFQAFAKNTAGKVGYGEEKLVKTLNLQVGDPYKNGIIIEVHTNDGIQHGLVVAPFDQSDSTKGATLEEGKKLCAQYNGYAVPDTTQLKLIKNAIESGVLLNNFQKDGLYLSSTIFVGNPNWIFALLIKNGVMLLGLTPILGHADIRGVLVF